MTQGLDTTNAGRRCPNPVKTYWHLEKAGRPPTEYELVTSKLHYYIGKGFEVNVPIQNWYRQHQDDSPFKCSDWEQFRDPRETTYTSYTALQRSKEADVDRVFESITSAYDLNLSEGWLQILERVLAPLRYPCHGLQMISAYVAHMAPGGRLTIAGLFQTGDELRRVQRLAYRLRQIQCSHPAFGQDSKAMWQNDPLWQPLRQTIERLLVTYDWGEAFVANNLVVKPLFDEIFMTGFSNVARANGDPLLGDFYGSLNEDCKWHRDWSLELAQTAISDNPENKDAVARWIKKWRPLAIEAMAPFTEIFSNASTQGGMHTHLMPEIEKAYTAFISKLQAKH